MEMFLLKAPTTKTFGSLEPRFYIDVDKINNFSSINNTGGINKLKTVYDKIRLITIRSKT